MSYLRFTLKNPQMTARCVCNDPSADGRQSAYSLSTLSDPSHTSNTQGSMIIAVDISPVGL